MDFWRFWAARRSSRANCTKIIVETDKDKRCMKFSALNIYFDGPSFDFLGSRFKEIVVPPSKSVFYRCWPVFHENCWR